MAHCCESCKNKDSLSTERLFFDASSKTLVSMRDGYQEYAGIEIGEQPHDKMFKVFRSKDTVQEASTRLDKIPITDGHIDLVDNIPQDKIIGYIETSEIKDNSKFGFDSTIKVLNKVKVSNKALELIANGVKELSLAGKSENKDNDQYDFEQFNIVPHHLAMIDHGRCGAVCSFNDQKGKIMPKEKHFLDEEITIKQLLDLVAKMPQIIEKADISKLGKMAEHLQKALSLISSESPPAKKEDEESFEDKDDDKEEDKESFKDKDDDKEEDKESFKDKDDDKEEDKESFKDSAEFKDALKDAISDHLVVITKAKNFLDESYDFTGVSAKQIMVDAVATQYKDEFKDEELSTAFKLLKKTNDYQKFGVQKDIWDSVANKEI